MSTKHQLPVLDLSVDKEEFITKKTIGLLLELNENSKPLWGAMTAQHMIEHLCFIVENSLGKRAVPILTPEDKLEKYKAFLNSPYGFMQNFKFPMLPENELLPLKTADINAAIIWYSELVSELVELIHQPTFTTTPHPMYGPLNKEETLQFHYKHNQHHLMQFGLVEIRFENNNL
jgi:hydroxymethylglutaryl-CoA reductase